MKDKQNDYHHGELRETLIKTGRRMLEASGADGISIRAIASEAGVSHNAPYRHFKNKTDLLASIASEGYRELDIAIRQCAEKYPNDTIKQIHESALAYVNLGTKSPEMLSLMFGGVIKIYQYQSLKIIADKSYQSLIEIVREGINSGELEMKDSEAIASTLWSAVHGITVIINADRPQSEDAREDVINLTVPTVIDIILNGILKR